MNLRSFDLNLLLVFDALMSERSVTAAAAKIGLSQPAMSNALARLRDRLGDKLFFRGRKRMVPTPRALELAPDIEAALHHLRVAVQGREFTPASATARFRLATTDEIELSLLPKLIKKLSVLAPGASVSCVRLDGLFRVPETDLQSGALDFAIGSFPNPSPLESSLFAHTLYEARFVCIVRAGHPVIRKGLSFAEFCRLKHVVTFYPGAGPGMLDRILAERGHKRNIALSLPHWLSVPFAVAETDLIASLPDSVARAMSRSLRLQRMKLPVTIPPLQTSLVWHTRTHEDAARRWFRDLVIDVSRKLARER